VNEHIAIVQYVRNYNPNNTAPHDSRLCFHKQNAGSAENVTPPLEAFAMNLHL
jgi:hypothetical protein